MIKQSYDNSLSNNRIKPQTVEPKGNLVEGHQYIKIGGYLDANIKK